MTDTPRTTAPAMEERRADSNNRADARMGGVPGGTTRYP
jgi:hypothetical protein